MKLNGEMDDMRRFAIIAASTAALNIGAVWSQAALAEESHPGEHAVEGSGVQDSSPMSGMMHEDMDHGEMPGMPTDSTAPAEQAMRDAMKTDQPMAQDASQTDHGGMNMQGGEAPADARDPHAYSGGHTLDSGAYALPGPRRLRLADEHSFGSLLVERFERVDTHDGNATAYDVQAWFGRDFNRLVIKAEGDYAGGRMQDARTDVLWSHAVANYWDTQLGARYDSGEGPNRGWLAFGVQGLAPYWFDVEATGYVGDNGRTALRLAGQYEFLFTQRLILQPHVEINLHGKSDEARDIGSGLSDAEVGLRLRYEVSRQFAPYVGVEWAGKFGQTADLTRADGAEQNETRWMIGLRAWF